MSEAARRPKRGGALPDLRARAEATRGALIASARRRFATDGYHATATPSLVAAADLTRGALYHHFEDKQALFEAVFREVSRELNLNARATVVDLSGDTWGQLVGSLRAYLGLVAASPEIQRILLIDGPVVLGWRRWRDLQSEWVASGLSVTLEMLMRQGVVAEGQAGALATLIQGAVNDAALSIAHAADHHAVGLELTSALSRLLDGLKTSSAQV